MRTRLVSALVLGAVFVCAGSAGADTLSHIAAAVPTSTTSPIATVGNEHVRSINRVLLEDIPAATLLDTVETRYFLTHRVYCPPGWANWIMGGPLQPPGSICQFGEADPIARLVVGKNRTAYGAWALGNLVTNGVARGLDTIPVIRKSNAINVTLRVGFGAELANDARNLIPVGGGVALQIRR